MSQPAIEASILAINALGAGLLLFISGVVQRLMTKMGPLEFKSFASALVPTAMSDPFTVVISTVPIFAFIGYFAAFGLRHWWFSAGIVVWVIASGVTKVVNLPIYNWLKDSRNTDPEELKRKRQRLGQGNAWRARITLVSVILMASQFSVETTAIAVAAVAVVTYPCLWLARRYA